MLDPFPHHSMELTIHHPEPKVVTLCTEQYVLGPLAVELWHEGELYTVLSICLPELTLADDEFAFKTYAENQSLYQQLLEQNVIEFVRFEFASIGGVPICRLSRSK
ncbi:MAG: hypothetical protein KDA89_00075 [Planctomycetaceae bacterium]|nr:hypothetical protein [Planctomycetaceae bacterium]